MRTQLVTPHVTVTVDDAATPTLPTGGTVTLDAMNVPYATATVILPLTAETLLDDLDPRDDHRVMINGGNSGHWATPYGYGHGPYGHSIYGGTIA